MADDIEREMKMLFDALNCEMLSPLVTNYLNDPNEGELLSFIEHTSGFLLRRQRWRCATNSAHCRYTLNCLLRVLARMILESGCLP